MKINRPLHPNQKSRLSKSETAKSKFKQKIKELVLDEVKKKKKKEEPTDIAPQEDMDFLSTEKPTDAISPSMPSSDADINPTVKNIQDLLQKAYVGAKSLGDEKLTNQIGNTITMLVRTQVLGGL